MKGDMNTILNSILQSSSLEIKEFDEESIIKMKEELNKYQYTHN